MNISKGLQTAALIAVLGAGVYVWGWCRYRAGAQEAILQQAGDTTDARVARLAADQVEREAAWRRTESVITRQRDVSRHRADSLQRQLASRVIVVAGDSLIPKPAVDSLLAAKDSLIANTERLAAFYQGQVASYRDTLVPALQRLNAELTAQRDSWRGRAQPGLVTRLVRAAPWMAGAYLLGRAKVP